MLSIQRKPEQLTDFVSFLVRSPRPRWRFGLWVCFWLIFLRVPLYGIDRNRSLDQLYHTSWTYTEGAPGEVRALAQTKDGYLWLGTATGLFRFDGIRFRPYKPQSGQTFPQRSVVSLFAAPDGGLWVGYRYGGVSFIKDGTVTNYRKSDGLPSAAVLAFARDRQGAIWVAAGKGGLARLEGSRWQKIGIDWGFTGAADTVFVDHAGTVWVGTPTSVAYLTQGGHQFQVAAQNLIRVKNFAEAPDGTLWMAETGYGVRPVPLPWKNTGSPGRGVLVGSQAIIFDNQGSLWITTLGNGIRRVPYPKRLHQPKPGPSAWRFHNSDLEMFTQHNGLTSDVVYCVLQDREGNVWFGTSSGLDRFRQSPVVSVPVHPISHRGALPIPSLHSFTTSALAAGAQGKVWAAGIGPQVLVKLQNSKIVTQLRDRYVDCAYRDPDGVVWFATSADNRNAAQHVPWSIFRLADERMDAIGSRQGEVTYNYGRAVPVGQGLILRRLDLPKAGGITMSPKSRSSPWTEPPRVKAIAQDRVGRLWISIESGTFRLESSGWTSLRSLGGPQGTATAEFTDSEGRIWFGFRNKVAMLKGDRVRIFSGKDGVQLGAVTSIQGEGSKIWIGGELGLEFFGGNRFQPVNPSDGSAFGGVSGLVADPGDGLWFSDNRGIIHLPEAQLRQPGSGKVEFVSFGLLDGLTAGLRRSLASPSAVRTTDGRIWFATTKGLAWINPKRILRNTVPPPVSIISISNGSHSLPISRAIRFAAGTHTIEIVYTALSFSVPERVKFRYRLEGVDTEWQNVGTRRQAYYSNLGPGHYRFRVIACNNDGVWNNVGASMNFSIAPAYYQTLWFRVACLIILVLFLWTLYRLRLHTIEQRHLERKYAEEALRRARTDLEHINRVTTMGELTASLAHEVSQPITAAVTNAQSCLRWLARDQPNIAEAQEAASRLIKDVTRAADIIGRIRLLFKKNTPRLELVDVNAVIREVTDLLHSEATRYHISIRTELAENPPNVLGDHVQLQQVTMNLAMNAIEATKVVEGTREIVIKSQRTEKDEVRVSVSDTGIGLSPQFQGDQIFRPFFTTKSHGTGMGLSICRSIVESYEGRLWATSNSPRGAIFCLSLPGRTKVET